MQHLKSDFDFPQSYMQEWIDEGDEVEDEIYAL